MEVTIDDYGRIVIPKSIRDRLGLQSGTALEIGIQSDDEAEGTITLTPKRQTPPLQQKGPLLVHTGELSEERFEVAEHLRGTRQKRALKHAGVDM